MMTDSNLLHGTAGLGTALFGVPGKLSYFTTNFMEKIRKRERVF